MKPTWTGGRQRRRIFPFVGVIAGLILGGGACTDLLYHDPADAGSGALLTLDLTPSYQRSGSSFGPAISSTSEGLESGLESAFSRIDRVRVLVLGNGIRIDETLTVTSEGDGKQIQLQLEVELPGGAQRAELALELNGGGALLFRGVGAVDLAPGATAQAEVALTPVPAGLQVLPLLPEPFRFLGQTLDLTAHVVFASGDPIPGFPIQWTALDPAVVGVAPSGRATALAPGNGRVRVEAAGFNREVNLAVVQQAARIEVSPSTVELLLGRRTQLRAKVQDAGGAEIQTPVEWISTQAAAASVSPEGVVLGLAAGVTEIQAKAMGIVGSASVTVQALPPEVRSVSAHRLAPFGARIRGEVNPMGQEAQGWFEWGQDADLADAVQTDLQPLPAGVDPVPVGSLLSGLDEEAAYFFRVVAENAQGRRTGEILTFRTPRAEVFSVSVSPARSVVRPGSTLQLSAVARDQDFRRLTREVEWTSADPEVAVVDANGGVLAVGVGEVEIVAFVEGVEGRAVVVVEAGSPQVETLTATEITASGGRIRGRVNPRGLETEVWLEWGFDSQLSEPFSSGDFPFLAPDAESTLFTALLEDLEEESLVFFRVVAENAAGRSLGAIFSFTTLPYGISAVEVTPGDTTFVWLEDTAAPGALFRATVRGEGGDPIDRPVEWTTLAPEVASVSPDGSVAFVQALDYGVAQIEAAVGGLSGSSQLRVVGVPAIAVSVDSVSAVTENSAILRALLNPRGVVTDYFFEWSEDDGFFERERSPSIQITEPGFVSLSVSVEAEDLLPDTTYFFRLVATSAVVPGEDPQIYGPTQSFRTRLPAPTGLLVLASEGLFATWEYDLESFPGVVFEIEARESGLSSGEWTLGGLFLDANEGFLDLSLPLEDLYDFRIRACRGEVCSDWTVAEGFLIGGGPPGVELLWASQEQGGGGGSVTFRADVFPAGYDTEVFFEWSTNDSFDPRARSVGQTVEVSSAFNPDVARVEETVTGLLEGVTYFYRVVVRNRVGDGFQEGGQLTVGTLPFPPVGYVASSIDGESILITLPDAPPLDGVLVLERRYGGATESWVDLGSQPLANVLGSVSFTDGDSEDPLPPGLYEYRMRFCLLVGGCGEWGEIRSVTLEGLASTPTSPAGFEGRR